MYISNRHPIAFLRPRVTAVAVALLLLCGCETAGYYTQAATGQWRILASRQPIEDVVAAPGTEEKLQRQLRLVQSIRAYASGELHLPVGRAYGAFVKLDEDFPIWNVLAAPEFSLSPKRWCYPIAGCASYRGYFRKAAAADKAQELLDDGYDVYLGPVPAYSTLGWFDDPVLSSFVNWSPERLAGLLFHELAHRRVYISGDTRFNESFATAVSELALPDWRRRQGLTGVSANARAQALAIRRLMAATRKRLEPIYESGLPDDAKRAQKAATLARMRHCYRRLSADWPNPERYRAYIEKSNNATLALAAEYQSHVPAFRQLYQDSGSWDAFYEATERLGELDKNARKQRLEQLAARYQASSRKVTGPSFDSETCMSAANTPQATGVN
ncbi:aminopeptidase [Microbulbifer marinus]|uniref:Predicted aminopeptidase n=1 Tax=Microbulbifer marinus TaxID=658218 RepID=A0A1H3YTY9_9GAMM|nr:aminopeptidase [Microbulbifer marinus]SEA15006.1 Predicted aminopeptidase [Microbulbifer marinus]